MVTGAFGYTGRYIAQRLLSHGQSVGTLTGHPSADGPLHNRVTVFPLNFDKPEELRSNLTGASVLYNTYWVRFPMGSLDHRAAVENTRALLQAAVDAGVRRIVHISITNASEDSPLPYFKGKGLVEKAIVESGLSYAILRPTVIFGRDDILINNIAWLMRRFPVFGVPGSGDYRLQPVYVEDVAELAVRVGREDESCVMDAVGPETYTFEELVKLAVEVVGSRARLVRLTPGLALLAGRLLGYFLRDVLITEDEIKGLMAGLLVSDAAPTGRTRLSEWMRENAETLGVSYASELGRRRR